MISRTFFAIALAVLLALAVHKSAAAEGLPAVATYEDTRFASVQVDCADMTGSLAALEASFFQVNDTLSRYAREVGAVYFDWHARLKPREGNMHFYNVSEFQNMTEAVQKLERASNAMFDYEYAASDMVDAWGEELSSCFDGEFPYADGIEEASTRSREHFSATANFFAQMAERLRQWTRMYSSLEGKEVTVPLEYFQALQEGFEYYEEASTLFSANVVLSLAPLGRIKTRDFALDELRLGR